MKQCQSLTYDTTQVWRVEWNITGTILSTSGDDGKVRLWKGTSRQSWQAKHVFILRKQQPLLLMNGNP
jgi:WD40 repeat protein